MAKGFSSPKLTLHVGDGFEFMKQNQDAFDVIITDSSDPVGKCHFLKCSNIFASCYRRESYSELDCCCRTCGEFVQAVLLWTDEDSTEKWWNSLFPR